MKPRANQLLLIIIICTAITGCGGSEPADFEGTYICKYNYGAEELTLHSNGNFQQAFSYVDGAFYNYSGSWDIDTEPLSYVIVMYDAGAFGDTLKAYEHPERGIVMHFIYKPKFWWGSRNLVANEDLGLYYVKLVDSD